MVTKIVFAVIVFCAVIVKSDNVRYRMPDYVRIKRAKHYSSPPIKFYRLPPPPHVVKGIFSHTPPPNYMEDDDLPYPGSFKPSKVSKFPTNNNLADSDINNLVKNLSKQDLNKIIEFAGEKYKNPLFENNHPHNNINREVDHISHKPTGDVYRTGPSINSGEYHGDLYNDASQHVGKVTKTENNSEDFEYRGPYAPGWTAKPIYVEENIRNYNSNPPQTLKVRPQIFSGEQLDTQESMKNSQFSFVDSYIQQELNNNLEKPSLQGFSENRPNNGELLPKPINLRENDEYISSNTNNVPAIVKANSYKVENFGDLPLMDYHSKLDTVSSYHVPHYSILSSGQNPSEDLSPPSSSPTVSSYGSPKIEPAPPRSVAREQSDAHLKAIKIWTHHSRGAAYTLHDDGTLSVERPKPVYGYS